MVQDVAHVLSYHQLQAYHKQ